MSALGPNPSFFLFWGTFIQLGGLLEQGLGLGPGLDNNYLNVSSLVELLKVLSPFGDPCIHLGLSPDWWLSSLTTDNNSFHLDKLRSQCDH